MFQYNTLFQYDTNSNNMNKILKNQIKRLSWYISKNASKEDLIKDRVFPKWFIDKYYDRVFQKRG